MKFVLILFLDELFGVTNNKQSVRKIRFVDEKIVSEEYDGLTFDVIKKHARDGEVEYQKINLLCRLSRTIGQIRKRCMDIIEDRGKGSRSQNNNIATRAEKVAAVIQEKKKVSRIREENQKKTEEKKLEEVKDHLRENYTEGTTLPKFMVEEGSWPGNVVVSKEGIGDSFCVKINTKSQFYKTIYEPIKKHENVLLKDALDLLLVSLMQAEDDYVNDEIVDYLEGYREKWGAQLNQTLKMLQTEA